MYSGQYELIRSDRKTLCLQINGERVIVRAPKSAPQKTIDAFVAENEDWISKKLREHRELQAEAASVDKLTEAELRALADKALAYIPQRAAYYAKLMGVSYGRITIRNQRTKWGSCSSKGNLNFNCLLMLAPPEVIDSVVVHELCHLKEMNHSERFYSEVYRYFPEYGKWHKWLKDNGSALMARMV